MTNLHKQIRELEQTMQAKKDELDNYLIQIKNKVGASSTIRAGLLGSVLAGFFLPKALLSFRKKRRIKNITPASMPVAGAAVSQTGLPKKKRSRLQSLLFVLVDVTAIISAITSIRETLLKVMLRLKHKH